MFGQLICEWAYANRPVGRFVIPAIAEIHDSGIQDTWIPGLRRIHCGRDWDRVQIVKRVVRFSSSNIQLRFQNFSAICGKRGSRLGPNHGKTALNWGDGSRTARLTITANSREFAIARSPSPSRGACMSRKSGSSKTQTWLAESYERAIESDRASVQIAPIQLKLKRSAHEPFWTRSYRIVAEKSRTGGLDVAENSAGNPRNKTPLDKVWLTWSFLD